MSNQLTKIAELLRIWGPGLLSYNGKNHTLVICNSRIDLDSFLTQIKSKNENLEILILSQDIKQLPSKEFPYNKVVLFTNNLIDFDLLDRLNTKYAKAIFLFSNKELINCSQQEKLTDFLILKITRYYTQVPIYVQSLFSEKTYITKEEEFNIYNINNANITNSRFGKLYYIKIRL